MVEATNGVGAAMPPQHLNPSEDLTASEEQKTYNAGQADEMLGATKTLTESNLGPIAPVDSLSVH